MPLDVQGYINTQLQLDDDDRFSLNFMDNLWLFFSDIDCVSELGLDDSGNHYSLEYLNLAGFFFILMLLLLFKCLNMKI